MPLPAATRLLARLAGIALMAGLPAVTGAQNQTDEPSGDVPAPQAIPLEQVATRVQEVRIGVEALKSLQTRDPLLDTVAAKLAVLRDSLVATRERTDFQNLDRLSGRALTDLNSRWRSGLTVVEEWEKALLDKSAELTRATDSLDAYAETWEATQVSARAARAPRVLLRQIQSTLKDLNTAREELRQRFREVLSLQEAVAEVGLPLRAEITQIEQRRSALDRQIFVMDAPPLWESLAGPGDTTGVVLSVRQTWEEVLVVTVRYLGVNAERAAIHLAITLVSLALFLLLRRQATRMTAETALPHPLEHSVRLLMRPLAATLLVLVFLVRFLYPDAPVGLTDFFRIIVAVPFLILALTWLRPEMRLLVVALVVLYALGLTREMIDQGAKGAARMVLLAESVLAAAALGYGLRPGGPLRSPEGFLPGARLVRRLSVGALALLVGAVVANVAGSVSLSWRVTSGVMTAATLAIFFGILVLLADGVLYFAAHAWLSRISNLVRRHATGIVQTGIRLFSVAGATAWFFGVLQGFGLRQIVLDWIGVVLETEWGIGTVAISAGDILLFAAVLIGSFVLARVLRLTLDEEVFGRVSLPRGIPGAITLVVRYTIVGLGVVLALAALGFDLGQFGLLAGALGVGLGFGLQNIVANFVSGIVLTFERPIQVGDMVQIGPLWGTISSIGVRSTRVRSFDGSEVVIPNNDLISKEVTNWTLSDRLRRLAFPVKVEFGSDPRRVIDVMLGAVRAHEVPLTAPEPFVIFEGVGDYYLNFTLYFWITTDRYLAGKNDVGMAVLDALKRADIQIPSAPHRVTIEDRRSGGAPGPDSP